MVRAAKRRILHLLLGISALLWNPTPSLAADDLATRAWAACYQFVVGPGNPRLTQMTPWD